MEKLLFSNSKYLFALLVLYVLIFLLKIISLSTEKISGCEIFEDEHGTVVADCNATGIESIPQNLGANIEVLDISNNNKTLTTLHKDDLKNYPTLWGLIMANLSLTTFPVGFFQHTPMLRMLNISNTQMLNLIEVPASVTVLNFTFSKLEHVNLTHLNNLEEVFLRRSWNMKTVPPMDKNAPLQILDMKYASLIEANYTSLAPFCHLRYFGLRSDNLSKYIHNNRCCELRNWCNRHQVQFGWSGQNCTNPENIHCRNLSNIYFAEEAVAAFNKCRGISRRRVFIKVMAVFIVTSIIILVPSALLLRRHYKINISRFEEYERSVPLEETVSTSEDDGEAEADQDSID